MTDQHNRHDLPPGVIDAEPWNGIGNEFAGVRFRKVSTRNGERLELYVPRTESGILLDPMALEVLADQQPEFFTRLIATRLGSADN
ncbi:hypothetical protein [Rhodococcus sp. As11]|uniref:hypothetical protein n=1 Tax=Rhodococcus sp. As11 TaxID=3029189 RepID=UPI003B7FBA12